MSQEYVLHQKCPACGTRQETTLQSVKKQRFFECRCCGLTIKVRSELVPEVVNNVRAEHEDELVAV